ncbi:helix-turn-helix domain-containing protein [Flagellimonas hymeniacidonis]|uniref:Helix-turn-helix domain-containing protein n=1 Tax=Flagellimonas hymeniacidonis TaxID=2603628 RepID=A0A5C8V3D5_9FLAO|nr:helix-turn-helix domain-containing protein [Flagellimonas hymeniacidonis]TXN36080.1 helix-turn-helix domain-containing protein [Flagellimonas hymeniacidonis]
MKNYNVPTLEMLPLLVQKLNGDISELKELIVQQHPLNKGSLPKYFGAKECCKLLNITLPTLYLYTSQRKIPHSKQGKRLIFDKDEILDWVKSGRVRTATEIQNKTTI